MSVGKPRRVAFAAAEEEAAVFGHAVVVHDELRLSATAMSWASTSVQRSPSGSVAAMKLLIGMTRAATCAVEDGQVAVAREDHVVGA